MPVALHCTQSILQWQSSTSNQSHLEKKWERKQRKYKSILQFRAKSLQERENLSRSEYLKAEGMVNIRTYNLMTQFYRTNHSAAEKPGCSHFLHSHHMAGIKQSYSNWLLFAELEEHTEQISATGKVSPDRQQGCGLQWESPWPGKAAREHSTKVV